MINFGLTVGGVSQIAGCLPIVIYPTDDKYRSWPFVFKLVSSLMQISSQLNWILLYTILQISLEIVFSGQTYSFVILPLYWEHISEEIMDFLK